MPQYCLLTLTLTLTFINSNISIIIRPIIIIIIIIITIDPRYLRSRGVLEKITENRKLYYYCMIIIIIYMAFCRQNIESCCHRQWTSNNDDMNMNMQYDESQKRYTRRALLIPDVRMQWSMPQQKGCEKRMPLKVVASKHAGRWRWRTINHWFASRPLYTRVSEPLRRMLTAVLQTFFNVTPAVINCWFVVTQDINAIFLLATRKRRPLLGC